MKSKVFQPPAYFALYLVEAIVLHFIFPIVQIIPVPYTYLGILLIVAGLIINFWSDGIFKNIGTTVKPFEVPSELTVNGPFRYSRNPMYVGMVASLLGLAILLGSLVAFLAPVTIFITLNIIFIPFEEMVLEKTFGQKYLSYKSRVRRWL
jgi:protein-S-isoprenylcysteine O-methyltransferase Ste14